MTIVIRVLLFSVFATQFAREGCRLPEAAPVSAQLTTERQVADSNLLSAGGGSSPDRSFTDAIPDRRHSNRLGAGGEAMSREYVAAVCQSSSAFLGFSASSSESPIPDCVMGGSGGVIYGVAKFSPTAVNSIQGHFKLPAVFDEIVLHVESRTTNSDGSAVWQMQSKCQGADESDDFSWGDPLIGVVPSGRLLGRPSTVQVGPVTSSMCGGGSRFFFRFFRDPAHRLDDLDSAAELISLRFVVL